ncbi:hypothetical protein Tc00.1047053508431.5 [Trypanosoma cruzi]|uniref:Uncharacterized protein n=1 Tax=Trypanosoma cruzi (strain CL Brener) TaxID=353153 RepID=Q4D8R6_TRYCC|nr:hypothetical protein Tc00.1047053508431.5 [Trypanosoma cruzi]EAN88918.1 hypothetical protein Tc00.1047053508431.5 [Trypanosoma cruzi]|eukprot:XP_810769.1 hypothetical protein [Trypanosoma cruzi strain CL Brener]
MTLSCGATWMAVPLRALCGGLLFSMSLPCCVKGCGRGYVWETERGWVSASPSALGASIHVDLLDGVSRHPGCSEEEDGEGLLWAEGGWTGQSPSVSFPVSLAVLTESVNLSECGMKGLCRFVRATQSSSLHAVVTVRCGAVPLDEGRVRCHGRCAPQPFIASAPALFCFFFASRWICWRSFGFGGCFTAFRLVCRLRFFRVMPRRLMGCLLFFLSPAASLVWPWREQWDLRLRACRACLIFCRCSLAVLVGEEASDCVGGVALQWEREGTDRC